MYTNSLFNQKQYLFLKSNYNNAGREGFQGYCRIKLI